MKYVFTVALATLVAARPIVDLSGQPPTEEMQSKRQGTFSVAVNLDKILIIHSKPSRHQRPPHWRFD